MARHENKKIKTKFRIAGTEYIFPIFLIGSLLHVVEMPDLLRYWLYNFNTLGDQYESATETNKIGSTQITTPSPTPSTPCTSTIKDIETLINKVQDFPVLWDKSCAEYKNEPKKKLVSASIAKEITVKVGSTKIPAKRKN